MILERIGHEHSAARRFKQMPLMKTLYFIIATRLIVNKLIFIRIQDNFPDPAKALYINRFIIGLGKLAQELWGRRRWKTFQA